MVLIFNLQHGNGGTALMFAVMFGRNDLVKLLIEKGADKNITNKSRLLAFDLAMQQGNEAAVSE